MLKNTIVLINKFVGLTDYNV